MPGWPDDDLLISIRYKAYVPIVTITALILATAVPWRRRLLALGLGWLLGHVFVVGRLAVSLLNKFSYDNPIQAFELGPTSREGLLYVRDAISGSIFMCSFAIPALIWVVVSFRRSDWQCLLAPRSPQPGPHHG